MALEKEEIVANISGFVDVARDNKDKIAKNLIVTGASLVFFAIISLSFIVFPVIQAEFNYVFFKNDESTPVIVVDEPEKQEESSLSEDSVFSDIVKGDKVITPVSEEFSIIVPKINANSKVIQDVDPYNPAEYQQKLTKGVAHAEGTVLPGELGNTFLFAHSSDNFYNANRYNSVFYLLNKMEIGENFYLVNDSILYEYSINEKSIVEAEQVDYLEDKSDEQEATLMTCWPPGTTLKRLILVGDLVSVSKP